MSIFKTVISIGLFLYLFFFLLLSFISIKGWYISGATIFPDFILLILGLLFSLFFLPPVAGYLFGAFEVFFLDLGNKFFLRALGTSISILFLFIILYCIASLVLNFLLPESYTLSQAFLFCFVMIIFCLPTSSENLINRRKRMSGLPS